MVHAVDSGTVVPTATSIVSGRRKSTFQDIPVSSTSHPDNPIPEEPRGIRSLSVTDPSFGGAGASTASSSTASNSPATPPTPPESHSEEELAVDKKEQNGRRRRASTMLISQNSDDMRRVLENAGTSGTQQVRSTCCGGGCCQGQPLRPIDGPISGFNSITPPGNEAFKSLGLKLDLLTLDSELSNMAPLPPKTPHPPYDVYRAPLHSARELTKEGAEKRTYHFDIDVTDYPAESGMVDFVVGGAIGVCPKNKDEEVEDILDLLCVPRSVRDKKVLLRTTSGRWPTIWGDDQPRELITTRRQVLSWCSDIQSYAPSKALFRLLAEYTTEPNEKKILEFLSSAQGQGAFCNLRTNSHITLSQLLHAFPSSRPPLDHLLATLNTLMPRFYSLSQDPQISCTFKGTDCHRLIEIAVTVAESEDWRGGTRTGVSSGYLEHLAQKTIAAQAAGEKHDIHIPMFRGLMANPLATKFASDGPMLLIGAGVGIAPFRGFVQSRLQSANCANKVWVLQGVRDSLLDELYSGEWGVHEDKVRTVVQSRRGESRYVQEEVRHQADLVWYVINALDGRVFVCGSGKGMGEGVEAALVEVAMAKGNLNLQEAEQFWQGKKEAGQYIAETW
ncbi:hypothetical protein N7468_009989 [Penicillium chermesinum]|uniref:FAD-binding FR-type domain-containing protein n=1 Tax=Penicillium chermesinum TaxID=63820 RepID=A0A9W9TC08_9EURO|nr:uncharacterized protein N7468_009989 [Penicillium chermesinum]KAJ5216981.1 hypothetical protein N7468_009989 [Penicillium chermesinum]